MNRPRLTLSALIVLSMLAIYSCNGSNMVPPPVTGGVPMSLTITDAPPAGVTVLSFEVIVTGATLNPGNVDLLGNRGSVRIEVKRLETEAAFLNTTNVAPGTYTSLNLTFANPELTFKNDTAAVLAGCAVGAVCEIKPTGALTSTFTFPSPGITVAANTPSAIQVDVNPNVILSATLGVDFSQSGAVSAQQFTPKQNDNNDDNDEMDRLDDLQGTVQNLDTTNKKFTLHTANGDFAITTDNNTQFEFAGCMANNFSCLQNNQVVEVDVAMMAGGVFLARKIEFEDQVEDDELEGVVFKIDDATHFEMVVLDELRSVNNVSVGNPVVVTLSSPTFRVHTDGLTVPSGLQGAFEGATDTSQLLTGQSVEVRLTGPANAGPPITVTANRVRLRMTQFTGNVSGAPVPPNFNVGSLPALFTGAGITSIQVQTSSNTNFQGVTGVSGLADGNTVSLRGLLFKNGGNPPVLIAKKVRKR